MAATKICAHCGLEKPRLDFGGHAWCAACEEAYQPIHRSETIREANERRHDLRKAAGQCQRCSHPAQPGRVHCAACAEKKRKGGRADPSSPSRRCARCGETKPRAEFRPSEQTPDGIIHWCRPCEDAYRVKRRAARRAAGRCPIHPDIPPMPGYVYCEFCVERSRETSRVRYQRRKARGQCQRCSQPARPERVFCAECARKMSQGAKAARGRAREKR